MNCCMVRQTEQNLYANCSEPTSFSLYSIYGMLVPFNQHLPVNQTPTGFLDHTNLKLFVFRSNCYLPHLSSLYRVSIYCKKKDLLSKSLVNISAEDTIVYECRFSPASHPRKNDKSLSADHSFDLTLTAQWENNWLVITTEWENNWLVIFNTLTTKLVLFCLNDQIQSYLQLQWMFPHSMRLPVLNVSCDSSSHQNLSGTHTIHW